MNTIKPSEIDRMLSGKVDELAKFLLPNGKRNGGFWEAGSVDGEAGQSLKVYLNGNGWCDFSEASGGDYISLWQEVNNIDFKTAFEECKKWLGVYESEPKKIFHKAEKPKAVIPLSEKIRGYLGQKRKLSDSTVEAFNVEQDTVNGQTAIYFPYITDGALTHYKQMLFDRNTGKKTFRASKGTKPVLFGWQALPNERLSSIIICEGEIDAMSYREYGFNALSTPFGGGEAGKQNWINYEYERLTQFEEIFLSMDQDEVGQAANKDIIERLGVDRCRVVKLPHKDINDCLTAGVTKPIIDECLKSAKHLEIKEVTRTQPYHELTLDWMYSDAKVRGFDTPWNKVNEEWKPGYSELTLINGINAHGKSEFANQLILHATLGLDMPALLCSMEIPHVRLLERLIKQSTGSRDKPARELAEKALKTLDVNLLLGDFPQGVTPERLVEVLAYSYRRHGCQVVLIDSLMKCGIGEDDYPAQKAFVEKLCDLKNSIPIHIFLVVHPRKGATEDFIPGKMDVAGAGGITNLADNLITVWRNKEWELLRRSRDARKSSDQHYEHNLMVSRQAQAKGEKVTPEQLFILNEADEVESGNGVIAHLQKDRNGGNEQQFGFFYQNSQHVHKSAKNNRYYVEGK